MLAESPFDTSWRLVGAECCPDPACACRLTAAKATSHMAGKKAVAAPTREHRQINVS